MKKQFIISLTTLLFGLSGLLCAQTMDVRITNIRNTKGQLCFAIFKDEAGFKKQKSCWELKCCKKDIVNGEFRIKIPFKEGKWGFTVLDDENKNGKMEYGLLGMPHEGFGLSYFLQKGIRKPIFDDFSFDLNENEIKTVCVKMRYF